MKQVTVSFPMPAPRTAPAEFDTAPSVWRVAARSRARVPTAARSDAPGGHSLTQARDSYHFELMTLLAIGVIFQLLVVMLILGRAGPIASATLRAKRRYAVVVLAALAAALPGTTLLEMIPLFALYELSIVMLRVSERRTTTW
jgi:Sec-independent protein secretion pathway component TatC